MDQYHVLNKYFATQRVYDELFRSYLARGVDRTLDMTDKENTFDADWKAQHYFDVGADAVRNIIRPLIWHNRPVPKAILDLPCGSGRVTRHLRSFFPDATIYAADLYDGHIDFCTKTFGVHGVKSKENFDDLTLDRQFDVIFCGSLLTHLPANLFVSALRFFARSLTPEGIAVVTLHGRHAEYIQHKEYQYIEMPLFEKAEATVKDVGFGYVDYNDKLRNEFWFNQESYGVTLSRPHWTLKQLDDDYGVRILGYAERGWDDAQDVLVYGRPGVDEPATSRY